MSETNERLGNCLRDLDKLQHHIFDSILDKAPLAKVIMRGEKHRGIQEAIEQISEDAVACKTAQEVVAVVAPIREQLTNAVVNFAQNVYVGSGGEKDDLLTSKIGSVISLARLEEQSDAAIEQEALAVRQAQETPPTSEEQVVNLILPVLIAIGKLKDDVDHFQNKWTPQQGPSGAGQSKSLPAQGVGIPPAKGHSHTKNGHTP